MLKTLTLTTLMCAGSTFPAGASTDSAWNELFAKVNGTCIGLSGITSPEASAPVVFDDATGKIAVLLRGDVGRGKAKASVNLVCLYDKKSGKASIGEYRWLGR